MKLVIQRVSEAKVTVDNETVGAINQGLLVLIGIEAIDKESDVNYLLNKLLNMRIFNDDNQKMNLSLTDVNGSLLLISQFTLHASTKKGNRPSFIQAARPEHANQLYNRFVEVAQSLMPKDKIATGIFGADMKVSLTNDGPVTIILDSRNVT